MRPGSAPPPHARPRLPPTLAGGADGDVVCPRQPQTASSRSYVTSAPAGLNKDEDASRVHGAKKSNFHEIFNLTENERPLAGTCVLSPWPGGVARPSAGGPGGGRGRAARPPPPSRASWAGGSEGPGASAVGGLTAERQAGRPAPKRSRRARLGAAASLGATRAGASRSCFGPLVPCCGLLESGVVTGDSGAQGPARPPPKHLRCPALCEAGRGLLNDLASVVCDTNCRKRTLENLSFYFFLSPLSADPDREP